MDGCQIKEERKIANSSSIKGELERIFQFSLRPKIRVFTRIIITNALSGLVLLK